jgi:two-component system heavy metal sensor histidine kinase CusS
VTTRRPSLGLRLTILFALASTIVLAAAGSAFYLSIDRHFVHEDALVLAGKVELLRNLASRVRSSSDLAVLGDRLDDALVGHGDLALNVASPDGTRIYADPAMPMSGPSIAGGRAAVVEGLPIESIEVGGHRYRVTTATLATRLDTMPVLNATLAMNVDHHAMFMDQVRDTTALAVVLAVIVAAILGWLASRVGLAPLRAFAQLTSRTSAERLDARIDVANLPRELAPLGRSFNAMLQRLADSFGRLQEFSADLAHELRTPIAALTTQAEVAVSRTRSAEELRDVLYSAIEEYERLTRMISDMLFLARSDHGLLTPRHDAVDLAAEVRTLFEFYDALAESKGVRLELQGAATIEGDTLMIRRALSNLLSNAIRHASTGTAVTIAIDDDAGSADIVCRVSNVGDEIPAAALERIFDRFYRIDPSRERSSEGAGLGLAITRSIIEAHRGTIEASALTGVTCFTITLPRAHDHLPGA